MIRLLRRRPTRRAWQLYSHPLHRMPLDQFHRHVRHNIDAPATWAELVAETNTAEPTTARGTS